MRRTFLKSLVIVGVSALSSVALAADAKTYSIRVTDMHCATCAKKIASRLVTVPGVLRATANYSTHSATITPQETKQPSPKALWEAVEKAGGSVDVPHLVPAAEKAAAKKGQARAAKLAAKA